MGVGGWCSWRTPPTGHLPALLVSVGKDCTEAGHTGPKQRGQTLWLVPFKCAFSFDKWRERLNIKKKITNKKI